MLHVAYFTLFMFNYNGGPIQPIDNVVRYDTLSECKEVARFYSESFEIVNNYGGDPIKFACLPSVAAVKE